MTAVPDSGAAGAAVTDGSAVPVLRGGPAAPWPLRMLGTAIDWIIVAVGAVMVTLVFMNVLFRVFGGDIALTTELCEFLMVWVTFLGGAAAMRRGLHMSITEFLDKLGPDRRRWADAAIDVLSIAMLMLLVWHGMGIVNSGWGNELTVLHIPQALQYLALPVGASAMAIFAAWDLVLIARGQTREQRYGAA
jgi:TRAP-type C4-dicarboxylate transport system permease small subunit